MHTHSSKIIVLINKTSFLRKSKIYDVLLKLGHNL